MKNEFYDFFNKHENNLDALVYDAKQILSYTYSRNIDQNAFILLNISNSLEIIDIVNSNLSETSKTVLQNFLKEEKNNIKQYLKLLKSSDFPKLVNIEWKFIGLSSIESPSDFSPKILIKLKFNNGKEKLVESDFAGFKKLQEDIEEGLYSYNSIYSKRVDNFAK
jgi:hypothetical protein